MTEYIWKVEDEVYFAETQAFFRNEFKAIDYANDQCDGLSWYMIQEHWWRGVNSVTGDAWSVIRHELN